MSLKLVSKNFVANTINLLTIIGVSLLVGNTIFLIVASAINNNFLLPGISYMLPLWILGILIIWIASKLSEIFEK